MGAGYNYKCPKCGEEFGVYLGIGMTFPTVYRETVKDIKKGKYGKEYQELMISKPYLAVNAESALYKCKCGHWEVEPILNLYAPDDESQVEEATFVMDFEGYHLIKRYIHKCPKCNARMKKATTENDFKLITCPKCGTLVQQDEMSEMILWD